jgi:Xaa-Pro aminopeptidase
MPATPNDALDFTREEMTNRLTRIRLRMRELELDTVITSNPANIRYATGFRGEPGTLLITPRELLLVTAFRTLPWAQRQTAILNSEIELSIATDPREEITKRLSGALLKIGIDQTATHNAFLAWQEKLHPHQLEPTSVIEHIRQIKSPTEVALLQESQRINETVFAAVLPKINPDMTERGVQGLILAEMARNEDIERYSFMPIVAAGPNCWEIHHLPDDTVIGTRQMLLLDMGVISKGYASDMTRTLSLGKANSQMRDVYQIVREAQHAAIAAIRPGINSREIDGIAREIITTAGFGETFTHGLGHSIGLETHDPGLVLSRKGPANDLQPGMALTIEPGIYLQDKFGVRIEDVVVVTKESSQNLTRQATTFLEI